VFVLRERRFEVKVDRLFLRANCVECAKVRAHIDFDVVVDDEKFGSQDQQLRVFTALSPAAEKDLLEAFGITDKKVCTPVLLGHEGVVVHKVKNVITHLRREGMLK
jgi:hypothetical protein